MSTAPAHAKINLALVVGPKRVDGLHEVVTVLQRIELADRIQLERAAETAVDGFPEDTLVRAALEALGGGFHARIEKEIPVAAGLGGGSSDAATALRLANGLRDEPLGDDELHELAAGLGSDVPFFLGEGPKLGRGSGTELEPIDLRADYTALLLLPGGAAKSSTAEVYAAFDERGGETGFQERAALVLQALENGDLTTLPRNDLAASPFAEEMCRLGAFRADVTGAGPAVYGLFADPEFARSAAAELEREGRVWVTKPAW